MIEILKNSIRLDFSILKEFCSAVDKAISDKNVIYITVDKGTFSMFSQDRSGLGAVVYYERTVGGNESMSAGVDALNFSNLVKKLYEGTVLIKFKDAYLEISEGNVKASFPQMSVKYKYNPPNTTAIEGDSGSWLVENLINCLSAISETSKPAANGKFSGILFDTENGVSRLCKFSQISLYVATHPELVQGSFRTIIPDEIAKLAKSFSKVVTGVLIGTNQVGLAIGGDLRVYCTKPHDTYPENYISYLGLSKELCIIPSGSINYYKFSADALVNSIDLVSAALGDADSWIKMSTVGKTPDSRLVWRVEGNSYTGLAVQEEISSSDGIIVEPFGINKQRSLKGLTVFKDSVILWNMSNSVIALTNEQASKCLILTKTRV